MEIVITGSNRGIGKEIAREASKRGHFYYGFSRWNDVDVTNYEQVRAAFEEIKDSPPAALVNNAGTVELGTIYETTPEQWRKQIETNLTGTFYCCKEYARIAKDTGGKIINIASTAGTGPRPGRAAYAASKAAVISFSQTIAQELKPYGIKVYCIAPGACNTDLRRQIAPDDDFQDMLQPEELAVFVMDIIEKGDWLDGQMITIRKNT